ncbi:hypothetical protein LC048_11720 [Mesobacillus subterraneus]|uniref:hypothetical protein n=1 Tax=Mesobacillus subterraneus TaxID=285983 RepID=UPI001CFEA48E|nr:hypothetical protein [Mesobacillus subterraneus]WLR57455.1 hypothetical protein LC048_11720 [Mesobacillus subterraneus]
MKSNFQTKTIQKKYKEKVSKKSKKADSPLWVNIIAVLVIVLFILNLYIDWL